MKWSLNELRQTVDEPLTFSETLDLKDELMARNSDIIDVSPVEVKGIFSVDELGVCGYVKVKTKLVLPSSRSLEAAEVPLVFDFTEHYVSQHEHDLSRFEDTDVVMVLPNDILDLEKGRDRVHTLAESLQAEIDEIEEMEIQVLSGKGERDDTV